MRAWSLAVAVVLAGVAFSGCRKAGTGAAAAWPAPVRAVVSIPPLKGLVEPLLPPGSRVTVLVRPGASEHGFEPTPAQVSEAVNADLLVWMGGMEPAVDRLAAANPRPGRADVRLAEVLTMDMHQDAHDHGPGEEHDHGAQGDPHAWLDPVTAKEIVRAVGAKVAAGRPALSGAGARSHPGGAAVQAQLDALDALDREYRAGLADASGRTVVVAHDAYGWLARRYGLRMVAISGLTAAEPAPGDQQRAREAVRAGNVRAVFTEPQISDRAARGIAEATGVRVLTLDPLGDGDYFKMMRANLVALRTGLGLGAGAAGPGER